MRKQVIPALISYIFDTPPIHSVPPVFDYRIWVGSGATSRWSEDTNWSPPGIPQFNEQVLFTSGCQKDCWIDIDTPRLHSFHVTTYYSGTIDAASNRVWTESHFQFSGAGTLTSVQAIFQIGGETTMSGNTVYMGDSQWECSGSFSNRSHDIFPGNSVVRMKNLSSLDARLVNDVESHYDGVYVNQNTVVQGDVLVYDNCSFTVESGFRFIASGASSNVHVRPGGRILGLGTFTLQENASLVNSGLIQPSYLVFENNHGGLGPISSGYYSAPNIIFLNTDTVNDSLVFDSGLYVFDGDVSFQNSGAATITVFNEIMSPSFRFNKGVSFVSVGSGEYIWNRGSGTIYLGASLSGGVNDVCFSGGPVETIVINATGDTKKFTKNLECQALYLDSGTLNINNRQIVVDDFFYTGPGGQFVSGGWNGASLTVSGNLSIYGSSGNLLQMNAPATGWVLNVYGNSAIVWNAKVKNSNASTGIPIHAYGSTDQGTNLNWFFSTSGVSGQLYMTCWNGIKFIDTDPFHLDYTGGVNPNPLNLYIFGNSGTSTATLALFTVNGGLQPTVSGYLYLSISGGTTSKSGCIPLTVRNSGVYSSLYLYARGLGTSDNTIPSSGLLYLSIRNSGASASLPLTVVGGSSVSSSLYLSVPAANPSSGTLYLSSKGKESGTKRLGLFVRGF